jgi:DNA-binding SARP family transcriptional activator
MPDVIAARLLGPPEFTIDGAPPPAKLLWRKHVGLCLVLWSAAERRRTRDQLIGLLWADKNERAARHSLNEALRVVRRAVGDDVLDTSAESIRWVGDVDLDIDRFAALESTDPGAACDLIGGPFCDGFVIAGAEDFDQWLEGERTRWRRRTVALLGRTAASAEDRGDLDRAVALAECALGLDPNGELAVQAAMRGYWLRGDRAAALAAGEAYRARLQRDLGVGPDERTTALIARVARERTPLRPPGAATPAQRVPLIAREAELRNLLDGWRTAAGPALLIINGVGGSGRSRLIEEFALRAVLAGATAITLRAVEVDGADENAVLLGLAASGLHLAPGIAGAPGAALSAFAARLPEWADRFHSLATTDELPLRDAFTAIVRAAAEEQPIVLAIDDADRVHPDELRWFAALIRAMSGLPMTLVLTLDTGAGTAAVDELLRSAGRDITGASVKLEPFELVELEQLVGAVLVEWPPEARARLARRLMAESAGAPAIAVEVLEAVLHGLALDGSARWPEPDRTLDATLPAPLPDCLIAAIRLAFRRLHVDEQAMLSAAALLDEPFSADRLGRVLDIVDVARRDAHLDTLEWERWVVADGRGYSFPARAKRRLIVDEMMTPGQRRRLEARIAACN